MGLAIGCGDCYSSFLPGPGSLALRFLSLQIPFRRFHLVYCFLAINVCWYCKTPVACGPAMCLDDRYDAGDCSWPTVCNSNTVYSLHKTIKSRRRTPLLMDICEWCDEWAIVDQRRSSLFIRQQKIGIISTTIALSCEPNATQLLRSSPTHVELGRYGQFWE